MTKDVEKDKAEIQPKPARFVTPLILVIIAFILTGIVIIFLGKIIIGALIALLGAVFAVGTQVGRDTKL